MKITTEKLVALCTHHKAHFDQLLFSGRSNVRVDECTLFQSVWTKGLDWARTLPAATVLDDQALLEHSPNLYDEVMDSYSDGGYDDYFETKYEDEINALAE